MQQPDTDIPGVWKWQVDPEFEKYGDRTGKLMDPEKVVRGRLTQLKHMNDLHVNDWIDEASIPKGIKIETSRWCDDIKPRDGDETNVRSRIVVDRCVASGPSAWRSFILRWMSSRWCDHRLVCE